MLTGPLVICLHESKYKALKITGSGCVHFMLQCMLPSLEVWFSKTSLIEASESPLNLLLKYLLEMFPPTKVSSRFIHFSKGSQFIVGLCSLSQGSPG